MLIVFRNIYKVGSKKIAIILKSRIHLTAVDSHLFELLILQQQQNSFVMLYNGCTKRFIISTTSALYLYNMTITLQCPWQIGEYVLLKLPEIIMYRIRTYKNI